MTRSVSTVAILLVVAASSSSAAHASDQPPSPSHQVRAGMMVSIVDDAGQNIEGRVESISSDAIRVARRGGVEAIAFPQIVRIDKQDSLRNGALTGLVLGASAGGIAVLSNPDARRRPGLVAWAVLGNAAVYAALGTVIDAIIQGKRTLYERGRDRDITVAPLVGPRVGGAAVRVSW